jgi:hypothetical protein
MVSTLIRSKQRRGERDVPNQPDNARTLSIYQRQPAGMFRGPADEDSRGGRGRAQFSHRKGLFIGQSNAFFSYMTGLAQAADAAQRGM